MAVDVISPDTRKKVDELFLYWLSEPNTQEMLRSELAKVCGLQQELVTTTSPASSGSCNGSVSKKIPYKPSSPNSVHTTTSPTPPLNRSPKSAREHTSKQSTGNKTKLQLEDGVEVVESKQRPESSEREAPRISPPRATLETIPRFYFPNGRPKSEEDMDQRLQEVDAIFQRYTRHELPKKDFPLIVKALRLPLYWKALLFKACAGKNRKFVTLAAFKKCWQRVTQNCHDDPARFVRAMSLANNSSRTFLVAEDFKLLIQDIVDTHPGLEFLHSAPEFHARYVETVIGRIFYDVDRSWKGRITSQDLRSSDFLEVLQRLEEENDINKITRYFSYEHFYVIYCKFWELDTDHDLLIDSQDMARYCDGQALTPRVLERLLSGVVRRDSTAPPGMMSYSDFIWFIISEEDKTTTRSLEYWFRVLDVDGDGVLSLYELHHFYEEVLGRLADMNIECLSVEDTICQTLDMIHPKQSNVITLSDLKSCRLASMFLNTFINIEKYLDYEQRDPSAAKDEASSPRSDWERFAAEHYEILVAEEQCEDDEDPDPEEIEDFDTEC